MALHPQSSALADDGRMPNGSVSGPRARKSHTSGVTLAACETAEPFTIAVTKMDGTRDETAARTSLAARWRTPGSGVARRPRMSVEYM
jgi:hypothetical protein